MCNEFPQRWDIDRFHVTETLTSKTPVNGRWKWTQKEICLWIRRYDVSADALVRNWASFQSNFSPYYYYYYYYYYYSREGQQWSCPCLYIWICCRLIKQLLKTKQNWQIRLHYTWIHTPKNDLENQNQLALAVTSLVAHRIKTIASKLNKPHVPSS